ncbi:MAG TPA: glycine--tRNA ligase subunit beta, partial [Fimbriimonadaceae bacterium]|nr:glycine--tRNA ligase subunit beta [Fimbriimonadaceae bacterium]
MPDLLFELGCEELPADSVRSAYGQLQDQVLARLKDAGLGHGDAVSMGTPRRLILSVAGLADQQPDSVEEKRGPALSAAYGPDGAPTKALEGFCRGQGVDPSQVEKRDEYVWVTKQVKGRPTGQVLAEVLPESVRALTFPKTMRWGASRMRFARPIRWIVASLGGEPVEFEVEGVKSGLESRGHRFESPGPFEAKDLGGLVTGLRERKVEPDPAARETLIREGAAKVAGGSVPDLPDDLVEENVFLTEWPMPTLGEIPAEYMDLPEPVLVTAMAKHERFFPVRDSSGNLTNAFVSVRNGGQEEAVRRGNQWVLSARFNDARFFYQEDAGKTMNDFLALTERMAFAEGLGTVRQRADRISALSRGVAEVTGMKAADANLAAKAGLYAKADLSTGLVSELASLQGVVGAEYAKREGFEPEVCAAIASQYDLNLAIKAGHTSLCVAIAESLDKLAGYLGIGQAPSGSSDPYGLRRAATVLVGAAGHVTLPQGGFQGPFETALSLYKSQGFELDAAAAFKSLAELFAGRYEATNPDAAHDVMEAALLDRSPEATLVPKEFALRLKVMSGAALDIEFVQTATRPINIVAAAIKKGIEIPAKVAPSEVDASKLDSAEGAALLEAAHEAHKALETAADP